MSDNEFDALDRVGRQPFASYLDPKLVQYDLTVIDTAADERQDRQ